MENEVLIGADFDGVFRFSNNSDEPFVALWNNKEYVFAPRSRSPIIIPGETLENIQNIRKKWAYKWAEREWYKGDQYKRMSKMGNGLPPVRQDADLEPLVQMCLDPLPIIKAEVKEGKSQEIRTRATKPISKGAGKETIAKDFEGENIQELGEMPTTFNA